MKDMTDRPFERIVPLPEACRIVGDLFAPLPAPAGPPHNGSDTSHRGAVSVSQIKQHYLTLERCRRARHPSHFLARKLASNGHTHLCAWCPDCRQVVTADVSKVGKTWLAASDLPLGISADDLPLVRDEVRLAVCYRCGAPGFCELHHVAQREVYGDDADNWPIVPLCRPCHLTVTDDTRRRIAALRRKGGA